MISGAVIGIVAPWLDELGIKSSRVQFAEIVAELNGINLAALSEKAKEKK